MIIFRPTTLGVLIAGDAIHVAAHRNGAYSYTAQPIIEPGAAGRRNAFRLACQRLRINRARVALALPEAHVKRHSIPVPHHRQRREQAAMVRVLIRRKLPTPASSWRYCLSREKGSSAKLTAAHNSSLTAAKGLVEGTGLQVCALIPSRDALRACRGQLPSAAHLPKTPAARLSTALAIAAKSKNVVNLLNSRSPTSTSPAASPRRLEALLAASLMFLALFANLKHLWPGEGASSSATEPLGEPTPSSEPASTADRLTADSAPKAGAKAQTTIPAEHLMADARRRTVLKWLDLLAGARPAQLWLNEVRLSGDLLSLQAHTAHLQRGHKYLARLNEFGLKEVHLQSINTQKGITTLKITATHHPQVDSNGQPIKAPESLSEQSANLSQELEAHGLTLTSFQHERPPNSSDPLKSRLNLGILGEYADIRLWLDKLATIEPLLGLENIWLRRASQLQVRVNLELSLFSSQGHV